MKLTQLNIYPVKSLGGMALTEAEVLPQGLRGDRVWLLTNENGEMLTARKYPFLLLWRTDYNPLSGSLNIIFADGSSLKTEHARFRQTSEVQVWSDHFQAWCGDAAADALLSHQFGQNVRLHYLGDNSTRQLKNSDTPLSFADGAPLLLTHTASLADLNAQLPEAIEMARFRPNLVVSGSLKAYEEETWQRIQIGEVVFEMLHPCVRCVMTTVDLHTAQKHAQQQPLAHLAKTRKAIFGMNARALNQGSLRVGDAVQILLRSRLELK